jgi:hypothetical protein
MPIKESIAAMAAALGLAAPALAGDLPSLNVKDPDRITLTRRCHCLRHYDVGYAYQRMALC